MKSPGQTAQPKTNTTILFATMPDITACTLKKQAPGTDTDVLTTEDGQAPELVGAMNEEILEAWHEGVEPQCGQT